MNRILENSLRYILLFIISAIPIVVIIAISIILYDLGVKPAITEYKNTIENYNFYLNKSIILNKDTLVITDYNVVNKSFKLSNSTTIKYNIVDSLLIK